MNWRRLLLPRGAHTAGGAPTTDDARPADDAHPADPAHTAGAAHVAPAGFGVSGTGAADASAESSASPAAGGTAANPPETAGAADVASGTEAADARAVTGGADSGGVTGGADSGGGTGAADAAGGTEATQGTGGTRAADAGGETGAADATSGVRGGTGTGGSGGTGRNRPAHLARGGRRPRRTWGQRLVLAGGCLVSIGLVVSASSLSYVYRKFERLPRIELSGVLDEGVASGEPENYLIVGVDNAEGLDDDDPVRNGRGATRLSDTIMVLRLDPASRQAALLSLPRDLWIPIPGTSSSQRINTMIERGGPELLIEAIDGYFGIDVNHYVQVDFASFQGLVEAVDGVPVYIPRPARDRRTGLYQPTAGCVTLDPAQALAYVRSRHYEQLIGGDWEEDASGDLGRIDRQQDFIERALSRAIDKGARNPATLDDLIDVGLEGITVDDDLTADDIFSLGNRFSSFEPSDLITYSVPVVGDTVGAAQILRLVDDEAEPILAVFRGGDPAGSAGAGADNDASGDEDSSGATGSTAGTSARDSETAGGGSTAGTGGKEVTPAEVRLRVVNGSGASGQGSSAALDLGAAGFGVAGVGETDSFDTVTTEVRYPTGNEAAAEAVAAWLVAEAVLVEDDAVDVVTVVTGADWRGVRSESRPATTDDEGDGARGSDQSGTTGTTAPRATTATSTSSLTTAPPTTQAGDPTGTGSTSTTLDLSAYPC